MTKLDNVCMNTKQYSTCCILPHSVHNDSLHNDISKLTSNRTTMYIIKETPHLVTCYDASGFI